jgi:hypothetical protein
MRDIVVVIMADSLEAVLVWEVVSGSDIQTGEICALVYF